MADSTVYIVDDDLSLLESLGDSFRSAGMLARAYRSAEEFLSDGRSGNASCLILDLRMPGMTGMKLIEWLRAHHIEMPVIVLSGHGDIPAVVESMKLGAVEFLEKPADSSVLINRVRELLQKETARCGERAEIEDIRGRFVTLSGRENELVDLLVSGLSSKQIAATLGIALKTVENHRSHVLAKTRAANVASLVRMKMMVTNRASVA